MQPLLIQLAWQLKPEDSLDLDADELTVEQSATLRAAMVCVASAQEVISLIFEKLAQHAKSVSALEKGRCILANLVCSPHYSLLPAFWNPAICEPLSTRRAQGSFE